MAGEAEQEKGREGARLARKWLERTTRARVPWMNPDPAAIRKLTLEKVTKENNSNSFSFDFGGHFRGEGIEGLGFLAECKKYASSQDQGKHFKSFLAKCYRAVAVNHTLADSFMWVTFAPFNGTKWDTHANEESVRAAVISLDERNINFASDEDPNEKVDSQILKTVAENLWIIVLSEKQVDNLSLTAEHQGVVEKYIISKEAS